MKTLTFAEAIREALSEEMARDEKVYLIGEDIGTYGGVFKVTQGLLEKFGSQRVIDAPISESAIVGSSVGAALMGLRPVAEIEFSDFLTIAMDHIANSAAKMEFLYDGQVNLPLVVRTACGAGVGAGPHHSQSLESWFVHVPGLKIIMPSTPYDAKGLLKSAIRDDGPVLFFEHKYLYKTVKGPVPQEEYTLPIGVAEVIRPGDDVTIITYGRMAHIALSAASMLESKGVSAEVLDLRTLKPFDKDSIISSVKKTGKVVIVHESVLTGGFGGEIAAFLADEAFYHLDAPIKRVGALECPVPASPILEKFFLPDEGRIIAAVNEISG